MLETFCVVSRAKWNACQRKRNESKNIGVLTGEDIPFQRRSSDDDTPVRWVRNALAPSLKTRFVGYLVRVRRKLTCNTNFAAIGFFFRGHWFGCGQTRDDDRRTRRLNVNVSTAVPGIFMRADTGRRVETGRVFANVCGEFPLRRRSDENKYVLGTTAIAYRSLPLGVTADRLSARRPG